MLLAALGRLGRPDGTSAYLRLSTRPVDQALAAVPADPAARERRRRQVVAGAYPLRRAGATPAVTLAAMGASVPEALAAADRLGGARARRRRRLRDQPRAAVRRGAGPAAGAATRESWILDAAFPAGGPRRW